MKSNRTIEYPERAIQLHMLYSETWWKDKDIYPKFEACHHKRRERNKTETSTDGILNQSSLTGSVICYRENSPKIVIQL